MKESAEASLLGLQRLDRRIDDAKARIAEYEPQLEEIAEPVERLETEVTQLQARLKELKLDERRLELSADERRARMAKLQDRLNAVRNLREEAAVHAEMDLVRRTLEADEQEALSLLDLIRRNQERLEESTAGLAAAQAELEPRREEIQAKQREIQAELDRHEAERAQYFEGVPLEERRLYERIKSGGRTVVVAAMTDDGACGNCFAMVTLQLQNEVRAGSRLIRCESCGVIVAPPLSEEEAAAEREAAAARAAAAAVAKSSEEDAAATDDDVDTDGGDGEPGLPSLEPAPDPVAGVEGVVPQLPAVDGPARRPGTGIPIIPNLGPATEDTPSDRKAETE